MILYKFINLITYHDYKIIILCDYNSIIIIFKKILLYICPFPFCIYIYKDCILKLKFIVESIENSTIKLHKFYDGTTLYNILSLNHHYLLLNKLFIKIQIFAKI